MKALMVGLGSIGQRHLRNLRALRGSETEVLAYRVRGRPFVLTDRLEVAAGRNVEREYGLTVFDDLEEALAQAPDVTFVCNPTSLHVPVALAAAGAGSHLFIEKPLSHDREGVEELARLAESRNLVVQVGYQLRLHPCLRLLRTLLQRHAVGRLMAVRIEAGEYLPDWHPYEDYREGYAAQRRLGGGVILTQSHELDYAVWLFGMPTRVNAVGGHLSGLELDVEDVASVLMECRLDGRSVPVHVHLDYVQRPPSRTCVVIGDAGRIVMDLREASVRVFDAAGRLAEARVFHDLPRNQLFVGELDTFLRCLEGRGEPVVTLREATGSLNVALAAKESLESGSVVAVAPA